MERTFRFLVPGTLLFGCAAAIVNYSPWLGIAASAIGAVLLIAAGMRLWRNGHDSGYGAGHSDGTTKGNAVGYEEGRRVGEQIGYQAGLGIPTSQDALPERLWQVLVIIQGEPCSYILLQIAGADNDTAPLFVEVVRDNRLLVAGKPIKTIRFANQTRFRQP